MESFLEAAASVLLRVLDTVLSSLLYVLLYIPFRFMLAGLSIALLAILMIDTRSGQVLRDMVIRHFDVIINAIRM